MTIEISYSPLSSALSMAADLVWSVHQSEDPGPGEELGQWSVGGQARCPVGLGVSE
jgi:hypothetical protein